MKIRKKPIIISVLSLVLCVSLVFGIMYGSPLMAYAVEVTAAISSTSSTGGVSQPQDNQYAFTNGAKIQIVGWYGDWEDYPKPWEDSTDTWWNDAVSTYNATTGKWKTEPYMRWQNGENLQHNFVAYWPVNLADSTDNLTNIQITLTGDSEQDDILHAKWSGKRPANNTLSLNFEHLMARFDVHLDFGTQYSEVDIENISISTNLKNQAVCDLINGTAEVKNASGSGISMEKNPYTANGYDWSGTCITVPQGFDGPLLTINFTADGEQKTITYEHDSVLIFTSGQRTTLCLTVGKDKVEVAEVNVSDWADGGTINAGEAEEQ